MQKVKYGVVDKRAAMRDLLHWHHLYFAGRLHKPVLTLKSDPCIAAAQGSNRLSALVAALLLLPRRFSWDSLVQTICGLSYKGERTMLAARMLRAPLCRAKVLFRHTPMSRRGM